MAHGDRANDNDTKPASYQLGDLEIVRHGRPSSATLEPTAQGTSPRTEARAPAPRRGSPRNLTLGDGDLGPALELDFGPGPNAAPAPAARSAPGRAGARLPQKAASATGPTTNNLPEFGMVSSLNDDFDAGGFAALPTLDVESVQRQADRVVPRETPPEDPREKARTELEAVRDLAGFGETPRGYISSVPYAFRVLARIFALKKAQRDALSSLRRAADAERATQVALGEALMVHAADKRMEPLRNELARVHDERAKLQRADQGVEQAREGNLRALGLLESEAEHLREQLAPYVEAERKAELIQREADQEVRRAQAMLKRVDIELRALEEMAEPDPSRASGLQVQREQRRASLATLSVTREQASDALGKARRELSLARGTLDENEEKQRRLKNEARAREAAAEGQKQVAHGAYATALCELAEAATKQGLLAFTKDAAADAQSAQQTRKRASDEAARFDRALSLYDRSAVVRGLFVVAAMIVLSIVALKMH